MVLILAQSAFKWSLAFQTIVVLAFRNANTVSVIGESITHVANIFRSTEITIDIIADKVADTGPSALNNLVFRLALSAIASRATLETVTVSTLQLALAFRILLETIHAFNASVGGRTKITVSIVTKKLASVVGGKSVTILANTASISR